MFRKWLRNWMLPSADLVKITRRIGEDEILEASFNSTDSNETIKKTGDWLDFLYERMEDRNRKVLSVADTIGGANPQSEAAIGAAISKPHRVK